MRYAWLYGNIAMKVSVMIERGALSSDTSSDTMSARAAGVFRALAHETRCRLVEILAREGEKCVCDLVGRVGFDQSTVSKHLAILKAAGIVTSRKEGLNVFYSLRTVCVWQFMKCIERAAVDPSQWLACACGEVK